VTNEGEVAALRTAIHTPAGPLFALAKVEPVTLPLVLPPREGAILQARMREALLGAAAHHQL